MKCKIEMSGASRGSVFRGWAGRIGEWLERSAPQIEFGKWLPHDPRRRGSGGIVEFECEPFEIVMYGANSKGMHPRDKTTKFGFAGLGLNGQLCVIELPPESDAVRLFVAGGWQHPKPEDIAEEIEAVVIESTGLSVATDHLLEIKAKTIDGFGFARDGNYPQRHGISLTEEGFDNILVSWPLLAPIRSAWQKKQQQYADAAKVRRAQREASWMAAIQTVIADLESEGLVVTSEAVVSRLDLGVLQVSGGGIKKLWRDHFASKFDSTGSEMGAPMPPQTPRADCRQLSA